MNLATLDDTFSATIGVFTLSMLQERGYSRRQLRRWVEKRWVTRICGRVFVRAGTAITVRHRAVAVHLMWPDAVVCFRTAAILHGMPLEDDGVTHVLVPDTRRAVQGTELHRWSVRPADVIGGESMKMTDYLTTLADCLGRLPDTDAWGMLAWMWTRELVTEQDLSAQLKDRFHLYGIVRLRLMVTAVRRGALSVGELCLQDFLEAHGVTGWIGDFVLWHEGRLIARGDTGFRGRRLLIEFDGRIAHNKQTRARDKARNARINAVGYDVLHVTWAMLHERPHWLLETIRAILAAEPRSSHRRELVKAVEAEIDQEYEERETTGGEVTRKAG